MNEEDLIGGGYKEHFINMFYAKFEALYKEKLEKTEWILAEALKCRSWAEIKKHCMVKYYQDNMMSETWYFKDKKILTVHIDKMSQTPKWAYRIHS